MKRILTLLSLLLLLTKITIHAVEETNALAQSVNEEGSLAFVDGDSGPKITRIDRWSGQTVILKPFSVIIVTLGK